jgi:hypothetical protein
LLRHHELDHSLIVLSTDMEFLIEKQEAVRLRRRYAVGEDQAVAFPGARSRALPERVRVAPLVFQAQERWAERPTPKTQPTLASAPDPAPAYSSLPPCHHTHVPPIAAVPGKDRSDTVRRKRFEPPGARVIASSDLEQWPDLATAQLPQSPEAGAL